MSIREALERQPTHGDNRVVPHSFHENQILEAGMSIFEESGVNRLLSELREAIEPKFPDVEIGKVEFGLNGSAALRIQWNHHIALLGELKPSMRLPIVNTIRISAFILNGDLSILKEEGNELITRQQWRSDPRILEDAIVRAYISPVHFPGSNKLMA